MKDVVRVFDRNLEAMTDLALLHLFHLGLKYGLFQELAGGTTRDALRSQIGVSNREYLDRLVDTYVSLGIVEDEGGALSLNGVSYEFSIGPGDASDLRADWVQILEELYKMADYAFISREHPKILMDFDKGADFWDMRMLTEPYTTYRRLVAEVLGLHDGMKVIDLGCGSVSPVELGEAVGPNGKYVGVDFSPGLLSIAHSRLKNARIDWVVLKEMDIRRLVHRNTYDAAIVGFVLEYFKNPSTVVERALEMLSPGGRLLIVEPFRDMYPRIAALEFFESLTPEFVQFPTTHAVRDAIENSPFDASVDLFGNSAMLVTRME